MAQKTSPKRLDVAAGGGYSSGVGGGCAPMEWGPKIEPLTNRAHPKERLRNLNKNGG